MRKPDRVVTLMLTATAVLVIMVAYAMGSAMAQTVDSDSKCPDYCDTKTDTLYQKGYWDDKLRRCVYVYEEPCKYGCEDDTRISMKPSCKEFPDEPPENQTELDSTSWEMIKRLYDKKRIEVTMDVYGTEYQVTDSGKVFVQLLDSDNQPIVNSTCFSTIYYPNATKYVDSQAMTYADEGLYYYDISLLPNITGVYMVSAFCYIPSLNETNVSYDDVECNGYDCGTGWLNDWITTSTTYWDVITDNPYLGTYHFEASNDFNAYRTFNASGYESIMVEFYSACRDIDNNEYFYFQICDSNNVCYYRMTWGDLNCRNFYEHNSFTVSNDTFDMDNNVSIRITTSGNLENGDFMYFDEFQVWGYNYANGSEYQLVRGSGELHITDYYDNLTVLVTNITKQEIAESVWNYSDRNLTYFNYTPIIDRIDLLDINLANNFTEIFSRFSEINTTTHNTYSYIQGLENLSAQDVWTYSTRTLTDYNFTELLDYLSYINQTTYDIKAFQLNELSDNLTQINLILGDINQTANDTYEWVTGLENLTAGDVWNFGQRNLTHYEDATNYALVQAYVWNSTNRNLTYFNYTPIYGELANVNSTLLQAIAESNVTLYNAIASSNSSILARVDAHNNTIMTKLYLMQDEIADMNSSIIGAINLTNSSLYDAIADANTSIIGRIDQHNNTIMMKLYSIQDDLEDIEDKEDLILGDIADVQSTADDIDNTTNEIWLLVWNLTVGNVSVSASVNWTEGTVEMSNVTKPEVLESQFVTFAAATSPGESVTRSYCLDNTTLINEINTTKCIFGECFNMSDQLPVTCEYGCYQNKCNPEPINKFLMILVFLFGVVIVIVGIALAYNRWG